ncbi:helix-turn-helix transcriptional regulator [Streptomyces sp. NPDC001657]|uniref:helix-turn-helix domain-containing protein n=1 Tax=unclassified Streptomyces TaxID=2593676 RepID=UPI00332ACF45
MERGFTRSRRVADCARALGYAPRTLSRATEATAGVGAKEFIDRRVVLEAERLPAHGDRSAARIADRLGFADATNFSTFFQRRTGCAPIAFRDAVRGGAQRVGGGPLRPAWGCLLRQPGGIKETPPRGGGPGRLRGRTAGGGQPV